MNLNSKDAEPDKHVAACRSLADEAQAAATSSPQLDEVGAVDKMLNALIPYTRGVSVHVQHQAVRAFANMASVERFRPQVIEAGVVPIFIGLLAADHDFLRLQAARGLVCLANEELVRQAMVEMRGIATVINVLPAESEQGQEVMVALLEVFANAGAQYCKIIRENHGVFTLAALLTTKNQGVLQRTTTILAQMVTEHASRRAIFETGAVSALFTLLPAYNGRVRQNALKVLSTISADASIAQHLTNQHVTMLTPLLDDLSNINVLQMVTAIIRSTSSADERFARSLVAAGAIPKLLGLIQRAGAEGMAQVRTDALNFFLSSVGVEVVRDQLVQNAGVGVLASIAASQDSHLSEVEVCLHLLQTLTAFSNECRGALFEIGGTSLMLDCIKGTNESRSDLQGMSAEESRFLNMSAKVGPALQVLANLCEDQDVWDVIADARGEVAVLSHMGSSDKAISTAALKCLVALAKSSDPRGKDSLLRTDVLPTLVKNLASPEERTAEMAAEIIAGLCSDVRCRDELLKQDSVQRLLAMLSTSRNDSLRAKAVVAIGGVCCDERFWQIITQSNGLTMLIELLFNPNSGASVKLGVCKAVAQLVTDRNHALTFQRAGGAHALTSVIGLQSEGDTAGAAADALANLTKAIDAANVHVDDTTLRRLVVMLNEAGAASAMSCISALCDSEQTRQRFLTIGLENALVHASKHHPEDLARQRAMQVLVKVLKEGGDGGSRLVQLGGVPMLLGMASSGRVEDKESALDQLMQISNNPSALASLEGQERDLLPTLVQSMQSNLHVVRLKAITVLGNVTGDERIAPFAVGAGAVAAMLQHHDRKNAAELEGVLRVICNLSWLDALHEQVVQASFLPQLVALLSSSRTQVQEQAATVVADLSTRRELLPHLVGAGVLMPVVGLLSRGNGQLVDSAVKAMSNLVTVPDAAKGLVDSGRIDCAVPLLSSTSATTQHNAVLTIGGLVSSVGERPRFLANGAVERMLVLLVAENLRHDGILYALGELCEDPSISEALGRSEPPWAPARAWLVRSVLAGSSDLDLRRRCAFVLRRVARVQAPPVKAALVHCGALSSSLELLRQQEDATLCTDLSSMIYDLALSPEGSDVVCRPGKIAAVAALAAHSHEPTRACAVRVLGLIVARGGIAQVLGAGGTESVRAIGMLAASGAAEPAAVTRARAAAVALPPMPEEGAELQEETGVQAEALSVFAAPAEAPAEAIAVAVAGPALGGAPAPAPAPSVLLPAPADDLVPVAAIVAEPAATPPPLPPPPPPPPSDPVAAPAAALSPQPTVSSSMVGQPAAPAPVPAPALVAPAVAPVVEPPTRPPLEALLASNGLLDPGVRVCSELGVTEPDDLFMVSEEMLESLPWLRPIPRLKMLKLITYKGAGIPAAAPTLPPAASNVVQAAAAQLAQHVRPASPPLAPAPAPTAAATLPGVPPGEPPATPPQEAPSLPASTDVSTCPSPVLPSPPPLCSPLQLCLQPRRER